MRFFDGINHPGAATVAADGFDGAMLYLGTPGSGKDLTAAQYADYKAHRLRTIVGFEHLASDWRAGASGGRINAAAFLADAHAKQVDFADPFWVSVDEHVAAADLHTVIDYVWGYVSAVVVAGRWRGPAGVYGFPEVTTALHTAGVVAWYWGAGRRADQPAFVNVWQDNNRVVIVGGSSDDEDQVLIPLPATPTEDEDAMSFDLTTPLPQAADVDGDGTVAEALTAVLHGIGGKREAGAIVANQASIIARLDNLAAAVVALADKVDDIAGPPPPAQP